jgi:DNA-binding NarL/FixJ family response regulator
MGALKVVIVEDLVNYANALLQVFENDSNIDCIGIYCDAESLLCELNSVEADVYLLDINLPGRSGIELLAEIKKQKNDVLCMMLTVFEDEHHVFDALATGANGYLLKETSPEEIIKAIIELKDGGAPMSPLIARKVLEFFHTAPKVEELAALSEREITILKALSTGLLYKEIADHLFISKETVKKHLSHIYTKLHVQNRTEAVLKYFGK